MTRDEAVALRDRLVAEHPDRRTHGWLVQEGDEGAWMVVKVPLAGPPRGALREATVAEERPAQPDDPRSGPMRDAPPYGAV